MKDDPLNRTKCKRGTQLPQAKLTEADVSEILEAVQERKELKRKLSKLTNSAMAKLYGVHIRTIDRITAGISWTHVDA